MRKVNQKQRIVEHIRKYGDITDLDALYSIGCRRLASRICDLKRDGYVIEDEWITVQTSDGGTSRVKRYWIGEDNG